MSQYHRPPRRRPARPTPVNHVPLAPRCMLCVWYEDCLGLSRQMHCDCPMFLDRGDQGLPRNAAEDMLQELSHDVQ